MIGQTISHYRILEKIDEGGMGVVYKAEDTRLGRTVAIKVLASHLGGSETAKRRFIHEARAASAVDHPHIATIHDIGETPDGQVFIAMGFYAGESLRDKLSRGPVSIDEALNLTTQIASGLAEVHENGIVHRDIKPGNIIVTESGAAKVVDFGLALLRDVTKVTKSGTTVGTVAYMSPEQARGEEVDARSDIFSLGCVLYELIAGRPAFGDTHEAAILYAIIHETPSPIAKYRSGVSPGVQRIVDKMLAKNPAERYASMREVIRDIDAVRSGSHGKSAAKPRRLPLWAGLFVVVAIGAAVIWKSRRETPPSSPEAHSMAIFDFREAGAREGQTLSAGLTSLLQVGLIENAPCRVVSAEYLYDLRRRLFGSATGPITPDQALEVARKSGADVLLTGQCVAESSGYTVAWQLVDTKNGEGLGARRVEGNRVATLADGVIGGVLPLLAKRCGSESAPTQTPVADLTTTSEEAYAHYVAGLAALERSQRDTAIHEFETAIGIDSTFALAWFGLGRANGGKWDTGTREEGGPGCAAGERAWALRSRLGIKDRMLLEVWLSKSCQGEMLGAMETSREIVARWPDDREVVRSLADMLTWSHMGGEAVPVLQNGLERFPNDEKLLGSLAKAFHVIGRLQEAIRISTRLAAVQPDNPDLWDDVGLDYLGLGMPDSAVIAFRKALAVDPMFVWSAINIARAPFYAGDTGAAAENLRRLETPGMPDEVRQEIRVRRAQMLAEKGQFAEAFALNPARGDLYFRVWSERHFHFLLLPDGRKHVDLMKNLREALDGVDAARDPWAEWRACWAALQLAVELDSVELALTLVERMQKSVGHVFVENAGWWTSRAEVSMVDGRPEDTLRYLQEVAKLAIWPGSADDIRRRTYTARAHRMLGQYDEAVRDYQELLRLYAGHYLAEYELAQLYDEMKRPADAIRFYTKFLDHWSDADPGLVQVKHARERVTALTHRP